MNESTASFLFRDPFHDEPRDAIVVLEVHGPTTRRDDGVGVALGWSDDEAGAALGQLLRVLGSTIESRSPPARVEGIGGWLRLFDATACSSNPAVRWGVLAVATRSPRVDEDEVVVPLARSAAEELAGALLRALGIRTAHWEGAEYILVSSAACQRGEKN